MPKMQNEVRTCSRCSKTKPITDFVKRPNTDRYYGVCKECKAIYAKEYRDKNREAISRRRKAKYQANIDEMRAKGREWYLEHREERLAQNRKYYEANAKALNAKTRAYYIKHADEIREQKKVYNAEHKDEQRAWRKEYYAKNKDSIAEYQKAYRKENADDVKAYMMQYRTEHKDELAQKQKEYNDKNREKVREWGRQYAEKNRDKLRAYRENYRKERVEKDPLFKMSVNIRHLVANSLRRQGFSKKTRTAKILGCDYDTLWEHLKQTWLENYGTEWDGEDYHIDHIIPLSTAKTEQDIIDLCHYKNLQMLKPEHNLEKKDRLDWRLDPKNE